MHDLAWKESDNGQVCLHGGNVIAIQLYHRRARNLSAFSFDAAREEKNPSRARLIQIFTKKTNLRILLPSLSRQIEAARALAFPPVLVRAATGSVSLPGRRRRPRGCVSTPKPAELVTLRVLRCGEARFLAKQLHRQHIRRHHDDHGDVERDQGAEHEERPVVDDARPRPRHDVRGVGYA